MSLLKRMGSRDILIPHIEQSMLAENWPQSYTVEVDTSPYYGKMTPEGEFLEIGSGDGRYHPSSHALACQRDLYVAFHPRLQHLRPSMRKDLTFYMTVNFGTAIHGLLQTQMEMSGLLVPGTVEWEYDCKEHNVRGRIDGVIKPPNAGEVVLDIKTINSRGFGQLKSHEPRESWEAQVNLGMEHYGVDEGLILAVEAGYPWGLKEVPIKRRSYITERIYERWNSVTEAIQHDLPPRCDCPSTPCWAGQIHDSELREAAA